MEYKCYHREICKSKDNEKQCNKLCKMRLQLLALYEQSNLPVKYIKEEIKLIGGEDVEVFRDLREYQNDIVQNVKEGKGIIIYSYQTGNGKTSWAIKILRHYFYKIALKNDLRCRGVFINVPDFFDRLRESMDCEDLALEKLKRRVERADLVIWDDLGMERVSDWVREKLYLFINRRVLAGKANIYTTNIDIERLTENIGSRTVSRILGECEDRVFEFIGEDRRLQHDRTSSIK